MNTTEVCVQVGAVHCSGSENYVTIQIKDDRSGQFIEAKMSLAEWTKLTLYHNPVNTTAEYGAMNLFGKYKHRVGRTLIVNRIEFDSMEKKKFEEWLAANGVTDEERAEGWLVDPYLRSQSSIQYLDSNTFRLNYSIYRFCENPQEKS